MYTDRSENVQPITNTVIAEKVLDKSGNKTENVDDNEDMNNAVDD